MTEEYENVYKFKLKAVLEKDVWLAHVDASWPTFITSFVIVDGICLHSMNQNPIDKKRIFDYIHVVGLAY